MFPYNLKTVSNIFNFFRCYKRRELYVEFHDFLSFSCISNNCIVDFVGTYDRLIDISLNKQTYRANT